MSPIRTNFLMFAAVALALLAAMPASAVERPFFGDASGFVEGASSLRLIGSGQATHVGQCDAEFGLRMSPRSFFPNLDRLPQSFRSSPASLLASDSKASSSSLHGTIFYDTYDPETLTATAVLVITDGTGRFHGAIGTIKVMFVFMDDSLIEFDCSMDGAIDY
jgi:hypothetical protein